MWSWIKPRWWKKCKDLYVPPNEFGKISKYLDNLSVCLDLYKERYPFCDEVGVYSLKDNNIKIQHYMVVMGFTSGTWRMVVSVNLYTDT